MFICVILLITPFNMALGRDGLSGVTFQGSHIQRSMRLMAESTSEKRNTVRVLFYGQSVTHQKWWKDVANDLKKRFPYTDLIIENHAIGGVSAPHLIFTAEYDLYPFYPDLLIFHVYGGGHMDKYEEIIRRVRTRTTVDILLWTHHDAGRKNDYIESERIRKIAIKYNCGLVDVQEQWQKILEKRNLKPQYFLKDSVHLNSKGCRLLVPYS